MVRRPISRSKSKNTGSPRHVWETAQVWTLPFSLFDRECGFNPCAFPFLFLFLLFSFASEAKRLSKAGNLSDVTWIENGEPRLPVLFQDGTYKFYARGLEVLEETSIASPGPFLSHCLFVMWLCIFFHQRQRLFPSLKSRFAHVTCVSQGWCWKWNYVGSKLGLMRVCWFYRVSDSCSAAMRISPG